FACIPLEAVVRTSKSTVTVAVPPGGTLGKLAGETVPAVVDLIVKAAAVEPMFRKATIAGAGFTPSEVTAETSVDCATTNAAGPGWTVTWSDPESPLGQLSLENAR